MFASISAQLITAGARALTGARALWLGCDPDSTQRIYIANHSSHADFVLLWSSLPPHLRKRTRPVAGADYWSASGVRRYLIHHVFNGVLVERQRSDPDANPLQPMLDALDKGDSLILFPEGTRNVEDGMLPFKSGIYRLALERPQIEVIPVWMSNLKRVMPKGAVIPLPLLCTLSFGTPLHLQDGEEKDAFLARARQAVLDLSNEGL